MKGLIVIPFIDCWEDTHVAVFDALAQLDNQADVLLIDNGSGTSARVAAEICATSSARVRLWQHRPPMPSLAATWNRALDYAWSCGYGDCMVWNNDVRVAPWMYTALRHVAHKHDLWFTTPVNCAGQDPNAWQAPIHAETQLATLGGPDFSCFLITPTCHDTYRFDERFQPAYFEDGDYHRRMWLGGDGARIAGVTLPYLHYGSRTINRSEEAMRRFQPQFAACKARYVAKWGGEPHHERKITPDSQEDLNGVETPGGYLNTPLCCGAPPEQPCPGISSSTDTEGSHDGHD
jgi:hypothetical protein